ncbi:MAG: hypothetical protein DME82_15580, partial [Verrucomicrobia bacterium]
MLFSVDHRLNAGGRLSHNHRFVNQIPATVKGETKMLFPPGPLRRTTTQFIWISLAVFLFVGTAMSQAQSNAADLQGVVRDPNGAVVVNANVSARNTATNASREATTNGDGFYKIVNLSPGEYELTVK